MKFTRTTTQLGLAVLAILASSQAMAEGHGWYGGLNLGATSAKIDDGRIAAGLLGGGLVTTSISNNDRDEGYKVFGGYQFNRHFAIEGGYFDLGKFGFTANTLPLGALNGNIKVKGVNLDAVGILPFTEKFSAFGRVGVNRAEARDSFSGSGLVSVINPNPRKRDTNAKYGAGLQYAFNDRLSVRAEGERYRINDAVGNKGDIDLISVGLVYRFGADHHEVHAAKSAPEPLRVAVEAPPAPAAPMASPTPPPAPPPPPRFEKYTLSATELFAFDSAEIRLPQPKLDEIANALNSNGSIHDVIITGYTDRIGSRQYNQRLSERRATAVKAYLTGKGVDANRLKSEGKGESNPVVVCKEKNRPALIKCLEPNRRVEVANITIERRVQ